MTQVIHAAPRGDTAFLARCMETGEEAIVITSLERRFDSPTTPRCGVPVVRKFTGPGFCTNPSPDGVSPCWHHR